MFLLLNFITKQTRLKGFNWLHWWSIWAADRHQCGGDISSKTYRRSFWASAFVWIWIMPYDDYDLPDHFDDKTIVDALKSSFLADSLLWPFNQNEDRTLLAVPETRKTFPMICGLLLRLRTAMFRVAKRSRMREVSGDDTYEDRLFRLMKCFISIDCDQELQNHWNSQKLSMAGTELARKAVFLSAKLQKDLNNQPLLPLNKGECDIFAMVRKVYLD